MAPIWLGDIVMALPAIADVRRALPDAAIVVAARPALAPLFELVPEVNGIADASREGVQAALLLPNSFHSAWTVYRAGVPERWGYRTDFRGRLLTRAVQLPGRVHQVDYYRRLVRELGFPNAAGEPRLTVSSERRRTAADVLARAGWDGRTTLAAIAPGAAYGGAKRWAPQSFAGLARDLARDGVQTVVVGGAADRETADLVIEAIGHGVAPAPIDLVGRTDLPALAGVLTHCRALITNDSGAMHVGAAVGVPVTAVFGPTDETATAPLGGSHRVVKHDVWCRPCMLRECPIDHRCMRGVGVDAVAAAARRTL